MADLRRKLAEGGRCCDAGLVDINGVSVATRVLNDVPAKELKPLVDLEEASGFRRGRSGVRYRKGVAGRRRYGGSDERVNAVDLVRAGSAAVGGGGGGRPDMAQAGGPDGAAAAAAIKAIEEAVAVSG